VHRPGGSRCRPHPCSGLRSWRRPGWTCQSDTGHCSTCRTEQAVAEQDLSTLRMCLTNILTVCRRDALCMAYRNGGSHVIMAPHMLRISDTCNAPLTAVRALHLQLQLPSCQPEVGCQVNVGNSGHKGQKDKFHNTTRTS
jgi:hypothetical protein